MNLSLHKKLLQIAVVIGACVPVAAGLSGLVMGPAMVPGMGLTPISFDSHYHYLSGLLLGIGLAFWSMIPQIEIKGPLFRLLTFIVVVGGLGRMVAVYVGGLPDTAMRFGLVMELCVTPLLAYWQYRFARTIAAADRRPT